jgi:hypothetical protein
MLAMKLHAQRAFIVTGTLLLVGLTASGAHAGEADDLQVMIDRARNGVTDLERLDERSATREDAALLRLWLDEAWRLRSEQKYDEVRLVLDRCDAQAAMIREKIQAAKLLAQAAEKEEDTSPAARQHRQDAPIDPAGPDAEDRPGGPVEVRPVLLLTAAAALAACSTPPKPPELEAFEKLRADPGIMAAAQRSPDLVNGADRLLSRSTEEWQDNDLAQSRNSALLGQVKLRHALAVSQQAEAKRRMAAAETSAQVAQEEYARLQKELAAVNEQVALLRRLQETNQQLSAEQQRGQEERLRGGAADRISAAELAVKTADTVHAGNHAKVPYSMAVENLARARQEMSQGNFQAAQTSAEMAKIKADEAAGIAKPLYEKEAQAEENKARAEALARDAASIAGVVVRREARGSLQRLVIPLEAERLFPPPHHHDRFRQGGRAGTGGQPAEEVSQLPGPDRGLHRQPRPHRRAAGDVAGPGGIGVLRAGGARRGRQADGGQRSGIRRADRR